MTIPRYHSTVEIIITKKRLVFEPRRFRKDYMTSPSINCKTIEERKIEIKEMYMYGQLTLQEYLDFNLQADIEFGLERLKNADVHIRQLAF